MRAKIFVWTRQSHNVDNAVGANHVTTWEHAGTHIVLRRNVVGGRAEESVVADPTL